VEIKRFFTRVGALVAQVYSSFKSEIPALGFVGAVVGITLTINQISNANRTLQATNAYNIQKDARELTVALQNDPAFRDYILQFDSTKNYSESVRADAQRGLGRLFNFYLSVFRQYNAGGISSKMAASFGSDFCDAIKSQPVIAEYWNTRFLKSSTESREMKDAWCP